MTNETKPIMYLDGQSLTPTDLYTLRSGETDIALTEEAWEAVAASRGVIDRIVDQGKVVYGVSTGFGQFANVCISPDEASLLQKNLIMSHSAGTGTPLSVESTRMLLALRINVLAKGFSGISPPALRTMVKCFNLSLLSSVPRKGSVGASGDLAPLSHLALGMLGMGQMWDTYQTPAVLRPAAEVLAEHDVEPLQLKPKEGLAMINGTQLICTLLTESLYRSRNLLRTADVCAALSMEALRGTPKAYDARVHNARPHKGQMLCASRLRWLLQPEGVPSELYQTHMYKGKVQDAYSMRCVPQVHGIASDTVEWVENILTTELNSGTDNPMVFAAEDETLSGGNFHGEYVAKAADYLAIGIGELANISERRLERMCNPALSDSLPAFLIKNGGLNSGFMIPQYTAASLVAQNRVFTHPASTDTVSTSAAQEDHVSMGPNAAMKCIEVVENVETVLAIELLAALQGIDLRDDGKGLKLSPAMQAVRERVRTEVDYYDIDRVQYLDMEKCRQLIASGVIWETVKPFIGDREDLA
ncbi:histidine ammonia-lyase [Kipferlia bialata]|uniref:Histidine ammonia-lyase n=1 Tax=Kipferlia bialata TaxID=797122 RepID=A0A9K3GI98_9EUKA|nr:histidine ammonia-lyase [Kipferlia bialata]|eukprot:g4558.t1